MIFIRPEDKYDLSPIKPCFRIIDKYVKSLTEPFVSVIDKYVKSSFLTRAGKVLPNVKTQI
jgi:hypothetical protein